MKILIVDDQIENLELLENILAEDGYSTTLAQNGAEGVAIAKMEMPGLILMDIDMPVMNGVDAMKILKSDPLTSHIPIFACTGLVYDSNVEKLLAAGFDRFIPKPLDLWEFRKTIKKISSTRRRLNRIDHKVREAKKKRKRGPTD